MAAGCAPGMGGIFGIGGGSICCKAYEGGGEAGGPACTAPCCAEDGAWKAPCWAGTCCFLPNMPWNEKPAFFATGAGAAGQQAIGTVVFGGMIASTLLAIPFVPVFYVATQWLSERRGSRSKRT